MAKQSADNAMMARDEEMREKGSPDKAPYSVESTMPPGMVKPVAPGEQGMGGIHKSDVAGGSDSHLGNSSMSAATAQLRYETERGEHAPEVGGHRDAGMQHTGVMTKD